MPEIYLMVIYFFLTGITNPSFGDFSYYFILNVAKISKLKYSMLGILGQI
jgi:hypothetical protein